jgi:hypothetical protein
MKWKELREQQLQARLDAADAEIEEEERAIVRRANLDSRRCIFYEERPAYAAPIVIMTAEELARL